MSYVLSIDQSTQNTKAVLFDQKGNLLKRVDKKHRQIVSEQGYVSHDPMEIYFNTLQAVYEVIDSSGVNRDEIGAVGISNQRETTLMWDAGGRPLADAVVWQCSRSGEIVKRYEAYRDEICDITGLVLSPYFPAGKMRWLIEHVRPRGKYYLGTMDSWLVYCLTDKKVFKTDASNASRTQLFDIHAGRWSERLCDLFGIDPVSLPEVCDSNACFGYTDFAGYLDRPVPIYAVLGDSHAALFGQGCHGRGQVKTTLGTGSSIMMNVGNEYKKSANGLTTSLAWRIDGVTEYVLEGNINYAGAVISWLQNDLGLIESPDETAAAVERSNKEDETVLVPAFSGLSAPYWNEKVRAMFYGMSRTTSADELVKAAVESIAYQITDILNAMADDSGLELSELKADGGPSKNEYLMQFLSDLAKTTVLVSAEEELSAIGAAYLAGIAAGIYRREEVFAHREYKAFCPGLKPEVWKKRMDRWREAVGLLLSRK